jgi:hypothetical protein
VVTSTRSCEYIHECEYRIWGPWILTSTCRTLYRRPHTAFQRHKGILTIDSVISNWSLLVQLLYLAILVSLLTQTYHIYSMYHVFEVYVPVQRDNIHEYHWKYLWVYGYTCEYWVFVYLWVWWVLIRYILVEYKYGFERAHKYLYSRVYTRSIPCPPPFTYDMPHNTLVQPSPDYSSVVHHDLGDRPKSAKSKPTRSSEPSAESIKIYDKRKDLLENRLAFPLLEYEKAMAGKAALTENDVIWSRTCSNSECVAKTAKVFCLFWCRMCLLHYGWNCSNYYRFCYIYCALLWMSASPW